MSEWVSNLTQFIIEQVTLSLIFFTTLLFLSAIASCVSSCLPDERIASAATMPPHQHTAAKEQCRSCGMGTSCLSFKSVTGSVVLLVLNFAPSCSTLHQTSVLISIVADIPRSDVQSVNRGGHSTVPWGAPMTSVFLSPPGSHYCSDEQMFSRTHLLNTVILNIFITCTPTSTKEVLIFDWLDIKSQLLLSRNLFFM